jgi:threonine dehydratase
VNTGRGTAFREYSDSPSVLYVCVCVGGGGGISPLT